jgi:hypothetical protein
MRDFEMKSMKTLAEAIKEISIPARLYLSGALILLLDGVLALLTGANVIVWTLLFLAAICFATGFLIELIQ